MCVCLSFCVHSKKSSAGRWQTVQTTEEQQLLCLFSTACLHTSLVQAGRGGVDVMCWSALYVERMGQEDM